MCVTWSCCTRTAFHDSCECSTASDRFCHNGVDVSIARSVHAQRNAHACGWLIRFLGRFLTRSTSWCSVVRMTWALSLWWQEGGSSPSFVLAFDATGVEESCAAPLKLAQRHRRFSPHYHRASRYTDRGVTAPVRSEKSSQTTPTPGTAASRTRSALGLSPSQRRSAPSSKAPSRRERALKRRRFVRRPRAAARAQQAKQPLSQRDLAPTCCSSTARCAAAQPRKPGLQVNASREQRAQAVL